MAHIYAAATAAENFSQTKRVGEDKKRPKVGVPCVVTLAAVLFVDMSATDCTLPATGRSLG